MNGEPRDFAGAHGATIAQSPEMHYPLRVPDGQFFAMGDNREASSDSRSFGPQPNDRIIGKVILRFWRSTGSSSSSGDQLPRGLNSSITFPEGSSSSTERLPVL